MLATNQRVGTWSETGNISSNPFFIFIRFRLALNILRTTTILDFSRQAPFWSELKIQTVDIIIESPASKVEKKESPWKRGSPKNHFIILPHICFKRIWNVALKSYFPTVSSFLTQSIIIFIDHIIFLFQPNRLFFFLVF